MSRYKETKVINDRVIGAKVMSSTEYPVIQSKDSDITYYVRFDDTYMKLANRFYNDQSLWWIIARANGKFSGNFTMEIGEKIKIPREVGEILRQHNKLNRV